MYKIVLLGYNFPHKKSENFIHILKKYSIEIVAYIGANSIKLNLPEKKYKKSISQYTIFHPKELCRIYNIPFYEAMHNSIDAKNIIKNSNANLGIISGARIIKEDIINLLSNGIINFHPGKIPEASGLDGLFWSIYKGISPFITTHFIDKKIDAGRIIYSNEIKVNIDDRIEDIKYKISNAEYQELERLCQDYLQDNINIKSNKIDNYIIANKPMSIKIQEAVLNKFEDWKKTQCK